MTEIQKTNHDTTPADWTYDGKRLPDCTDGELEAANDGWIQLLQDVMQDLGIPWFRGKDSEWVRFLRYLEEHAHKLELRASFLRMVRQEQDRRGRA